eukprot:3061333-Rhodomonas_salina.1
MLLPGLADPYGLALTKAIPSRWRTVCARKVGSWPATDSGPSALRFRSCHDHAIDWINHACLGSGDTASG